MPRISLYRPEKSRDYEFMDKIIFEQTADERQKDADKLLDMIGL